MTITPEEFTKHLNQLRAGIEEDKLISSQFNDPVQPEVQVLETLIRSYDENAALRDRVEALEWLVEVQDFNFWNSKPRTAEKFTPHFANASREYDRTYYAAREALK